MSRVECPSEAIEKKVLEEVCDRRSAGVDNVKDPLDSTSEWIEYELGVDPEGLISDIVAVAYTKGYAQAGKDRADGQEKE